MHTDSHVDKVSHGDLRLRCGNSRCDADEESGEDCELHVEWCSMLKILCNLKMFVVLVGEQ
jgi:hypothetical protein